KISGPALKLLQKKPVRSVSGINVVAAMLKPHACPGKCVFCPSGLSGNETPKSYTGFEPAAMRGLRNEFDPYRQVSSRIRQFTEAGHSASKIELIVMGGTFCSLPEIYQRDFTRQCLNAITGKNSQTLETAKLEAEKSKRRLTGVTFETRPDYCSQKQIDLMLDCCATRIELGVQTTSEKVYAKTMRGHGRKEAISATQLLKDSALKVCYHMMPGLPGSTLREDLKSLKEIFSNPDYRPDMLKVYPCLVVSGTKLYEDWKHGKFEPLSSPEAAGIIAAAKESFPKWVRVMRIQRDIPAQYISAGVRASNLRQLVEGELRKNGAKCNCIRCREAGLQEYKSGKKLDFSKAKIFREDYDASKGTEVFISAELPKDDLLLGFCRLRIPSNPHRKELQGKTGLVRELHVYGSVVPLGNKPETEIQHRGFGSRLLLEAEKIAEEEFDCKKLAVISGIGVRGYYHNRGYETEGPYVSKAFK
ncbi:MAG: tRNA uridine(34) 5-carboxymethylaminomethyl modification radical SAM/GNAT enzyme Elp3, partial [archaeon]